MPFHNLTDRFNALFGALNPSPSFTATAQSEHSTVAALLTRTDLPCWRYLRPYIFLQGSYKQQTAIYTINDVDIVLLCNLGKSSLYQQGIDANNRYWTRDQIFSVVAETLAASHHYKGKIKYNSKSMCVKIELGIKVEILPVLRRTLESPNTEEPFLLYRPAKDLWEDGFARKHQSLLSEKNQRTGGNFIPAIKVFKHIRSFHNIPSVSFHIECLLYKIPDEVFKGSPAVYIAALLNHLQASPAEAYKTTYLRTPCGDRDIFTSAEWEFESWKYFHSRIQSLSYAASIANLSQSKVDAITYWQKVLGDNYFPRWSNL